MNDRLLKTIEKLKNEIDSLKKEIKDLKNSSEMNESLKALIQNIEPYTIKNDEWYKGDTPTGNKSKGKDFTFDDLTDEQITLLSGADGKNFTFDDLTDEQIALLSGADGKDATSFDNFDETKIQTLKNIRGVIQWVNN